MITGIVWLSFVYAGPAKGENKEALNPNIKTLSPITVNRTLRAIRILPIFRDEGKLYI